jgi:hypothetical protein
MAGRRIAVTIDVVGFDRSETPATRIDPAVCECQTTQCFILCRLCFSQGCSIILSVPICKPDAHNSMCVAAVFELEIDVTLDRQATRGFA